MTNISGPRDNNRVVTLMGVSSVDGVTPVVVYVDPITHRLLVDATGGGGTPGGADTQVQFNDAGAFNGDSGFIYNKTTKAVTLVQGTITASQPQINLTSTWNNGAVNFVGGLINITSTASGSDSLFLDIQLAGSSTFAFKKNGFFRLGLGSGTGTDAPHLGVYASPLFGNCFSVMNSSGSQSSADLYKFNASGGYFQYNGTRYVFRTDTENIDIASDVLLRFSSTSSAAGTKDTGLARNAAGVIEVNNGTAGTLRDIQVRNFTGRIVPRVTSITSSATPTINTDNCDAVTITALAADITSMTTNLSGAPNNFDKLTFRFKDNGTARAITWGASFEAKGVALPTTTVISKVLTVGFIYDSVTSKWGCVASAQEA